jgi:hypothetical protein
MKGRWGAFLEWIRDPFSDARPSSPGLWAARLTLFVPIATVFIAICHGLVSEEIPWRWAIILGVAIGVAVTGYIEYTERRDH